MRIFELNKKDMKAIRRISKFNFTEKELKVLIEMLEIYNGKNIEKIVKIDDKYHVYETIFCKD